MRKDNTTGGILQALEYHKNKGLMLAASYNRLGQPDRAQLVLDCGTYVGLAEIGGKTKIVEANFCKQRLCPACAWRRSLKIYGATSQILNYLDATRGREIKYLFLTLTVRNVRLPDLGQAIDDMAAAFKRLTNNKAWQRRVLGAMRTLEVTINHDTNMAHPHYHLILAVRRSYATKNDNTYWTHEDWQRAWQRAARLDYMPQVSIERIKGSREEGIAEVSKYMAKAEDYLIDSTEAQMGTEEAEAMTDWLVSNLSTQLHGRRLVSYTGILREAQRALKLSDPEDGDLTDTIRGDIAQAIKRYHWSAGLGRYVPGLPSERRT